jgi:hypothetical protein
VALSDGRSIPEEVNDTRFDYPVLGEGRAGPIVFSVINTNPIIITAADTYTSTVLGEGRGAIVFGVIDFEEGPIMLEQSAFVTTVLGLGHKLRITQTGFGSVIIT